jgi:excisionase family DNA binding protein
MLVDRSWPDHDAADAFIAGVHHPLPRSAVMTAGEVAELLRLPLSTVYELARKGELPPTRFGRTWRFLRTRIEEMLAS